MRVTNQEPERPAKEISSFDWPVYRKRPLPKGELQGLFLLSEPLIAATREALVRFALAGMYEGGHEGMVFWAGREMPGCTVFLQAIVPDADHAPGRVQASMEAVGEVERAAHGSRLGVLCQVHSHPGGDARHSDGDDHMILLPFPGMLSIVMPHFGVDFTSLRNACVHQYQDSQWVLCTPESVRQNIIVVPSAVDLR